MHFFELHRGDCSLGRRSLAGFCLTWKNPREVGGGSWARGPGTGFDTKRKAKFLGISLTQPDFVWGSRARLGVRYPPGGLKKNPGFFLSVLGY